MLDGYAGERFLGEGGFARVVAVRRLADGLEVALKTARHPGDERFAREAAALRRLGPPTSPALLGEGLTEDGRPYLVLELLDGRTLEAVGPVGRVEALRLIGALAASVDVMHAAGVVHRDLKPGNAFVRPDGGVTLLDFGLAKSSPDLAERASDPGGDELTRTGDVLGTPLYMAPEQCAGASNVGAAADVYAVGVLAFELLTGAPPFTGAATVVRQAHAAQRPPRASERGGLPVAVDALFARCLAKAPGARFASAGEFARALASAVAEPREASGANAGGAALAASGAMAAGAGGGLGPGPSRAAAAERPVALLAVATSAAVSVLTGLVVPLGGQVERAGAEGYLIAFPGREGAVASVREAVRAARQLAARFGARTPMLVHLAKLRVRPRPRGVTLAGPALADPSSWWRGATEGLCLTPEAAAVHGAEDSEAEDASLGASRAPLRGRDALVLALVGEAGAALAGGGPALATVIGEAGLGKTRLLEELATELGERGRVVVLSARSVGHGDPAWLAAALLRLGLGLGARPSVEQVREACGARLEARLAEASWPAVALALEVIGETHPAARAVLDVPGALRPLLARATAEGLRRAAAERPLVLLVDDAERADAAGLDALELAAGSGPPAALWIAVSGRPELEAQRPSWGDRAARHERHVLAPLDAGAASALLLDRLQPVEFVPEAVTVRLAEAAGGVPLLLHELASAVRTHGALRAHPGGKGFFLASDELLALSTTPLAERLAGARLDPLPPSLFALARLCAVLGAEVDAAEVEAVALALPEGDPVAAIDTLVGLARLVRQGVLRQAGPGVYGFTHPALRRALEAATPAAAWRKLHAAALEHLERRTGEGSVAASLDGGAVAGGPRAGDLARIACHADACGARERALAAHRRLAEEHARAERHDEAGPHFTAALAQVAAGDDGTRGELLRGRARARYRVQRFHDALDDVRAARALAEARGDGTAELLLEEATLLDWLQDWAGSAELTRRAASLAPAGGDDPRLAARRDMAVGRAHYRAERLPPAIEALERGATAAAGHGDHETRVIALLLLAPALVFAGRLDDAEARFDEVVALCRRTGDLLHLGASYVNRLALWTARKLPERGHDDLRAALALARELGNAALERIPTFNLAELLFWAGRLDEALPLARRARELQQRYFDDPPLPDDALLLARILCARGDLAEARELAAWVRARCPADTLAPTARTLLRAVELTLSGEDATEPWRLLVEEARAASLVDELAEVEAAARRALSPG